ncbi:accessory gene regulator ArgB-like protein [Ruminiclostridium cellulolyticum]|uniref:Accessory gene regulator B n=1 Tax=Ruminiclostridium cellulolyticum (strain ATCC 35319 / DSM 5812 / JCM 6584 / H10) TaxID=394503 RepID=B8I438_RUMCH|nr:accessory gene regulator B family protein [Ruminiclostridium cellulolyticum]ACL76471.1 Accessory gene regulator B [Ruminiclostridium cellulolyticum H10]
MLEVITKKITNEIVLNVPGITEEKAEQIDYGLYMALADGLKLLAVLIAALLLGQLKYAVVAVIVFSLNKSYLGGVHAKTQIGCVITHFLFIFGTVYLAQILNIKFLNIVLFAISGIFVFLYAPADLVSKPIVTEKRKRELRIKGSILLVICFTVTLIVPNIYSNIISVITIISSVNITPIVYRLTKNKRGGIIT